MVMEDRPPDDWTRDDWEKLTAGQQAPTASVEMQPVDARFVLASCRLWVPPTGLEGIAVFQASDYERLPVLALFAKVLFASVPSTAMKVDLTAGEISYCLHFLHGNDSYQGGAGFEERLLTALQTLLKGGEKGCQRQR